VIESFDNLPIAAIMNDRIFCVHAGISPELRSREDILRITKPKDDPITGIEGDMLWSDFDDCVEEYEVNEARGSGFIFGRKFTDSFLKNCEFTTIIRSHESVDSHAWPFEPEEGCLTVFTAMDYMGQMNDGGVTSVDDAHIEVHTLRAIFKNGTKKWMPLWPPWILRDSCFKGGLEAGSLRRVFSEPLTTELRTTMDVEIIV
jgi:serine/threonine-protein phosphatase PP1 catalytic subunit